MYLIASVDLFTAVGVSLNPYSNGTMYLIRQGTGTLRQAEASLNPYSNGTMYLIY